ncbi:mitochondrial import receptor subunit TOM22 homolog [Gracilinanus agilis]|uniref:mitochondrial import receptor subunit TOM22 homolog n=1 Tax=Gracilinanus agilis TaxID=191870 RepID=UPI001CFEBC49|nr:mitochondrial import receptor subunit TOM22 homolog [Gracilinanus agilis]
MLIRFLAVTALTGSSVCIRRGSKDKLDTLKKGSFNPMRSQVEMLHRHQGRHLENSNTKDFQELHLFVIYSSALPADHRTPRDHVLGDFNAPPSPTRACGILMATAVAASSLSGSSVSTDELPPQGGTDKTEEELENEDETLAKRLWGLAEMFPESIRSAAEATFDLSLSVAQKMYWFSRAALWIGTTSFMILVLLVVFETEKLQMEQQQQLQQWQILLGPNTSLSGGMPGALPPLPGKI